MGIVFLGVVLLLLLDATLSVRHDVTLFENTMRRNELLFGRTVREAVQDAWRRDGMQSALDFVRRIDRQPNHMLIRLVRLNARPGSPRAPRIAFDKPPVLKDGQAFSTRQESASGPGFLVTYVPVSIPDIPYGALEVSQSLTELKAYIRTRVLRSVVLVMILAVFSGIMLWIFGRRIIGRPLDQLVEKTRRIGSGDFSTPLHFSGGNELATLAEATNEMCRQLARARDALREEAEARIQALEQLRHSDRLATLGRLSSGIAHELGTPLNVVSGRARMIASGSLEPQEVLQSAGIIDDQAKRMTALIRQLLDFARRRAPNKARVDLNRLAEQVVQILASEAAKENIQLDFLPADHDVGLWVDAFQIQQVLTNLVMNAIQATGGGGRVQISVQTQSPPADRQETQSAEYTTIQVRDRGQGISRDDLENIFTPFFTTKKAGRGTGLGLSIAQGIVEEHGGWIDVESRPGQGTCFTVWLPREEAACTEAS
jgi:signal transduction histidine kinase